MIDVRLLEHKLRDTFCTIGMVPSLCGSMLLITSKLARADCVTTYDESEADVYDSKTTAITVMERSVLHV